MKFAFCLLLSSLWTFAWAASSCPNDPNSLQWTSVDCAKIQLPYGTNKIVPSSSGPYTPPQPLPMAPNGTNAALRQNYFQSISTILKGSTNSSPGQAGNSGSSIAGSTDCQQCTETFQALHEAALKLSPDDITTLLVQLCQAGFQLFGGQPCQALYAGSASDGPYMAQMFYLLNNATQDIQALCTYGHSINCQAPPVVKIKESDWFSSPKKATASSPGPQPSSSGKTIHVVHMSDIHLDTRYVLGSPEGCRDEGTAGSGSTRWGEYTCDVPGDLLLSAFSTMKNLIKMDDVAFGIFTGDIVNHDDNVELSKDFVKFEEQNVFDAFKAEMTNSKGTIPIFASLGNHDSYPEMVANNDSFWNFDFLADMWQKNNWLTDSAASDVRTQFGAYAISNPNGLNGLKIISLNTDFWYVDNFFNYLNYTNPDPNGMLKFLIKELEASEAANQRVWIIGHVPSGYASGSALPNPTALFQSIVARFSPTTIAAIFWGHTHWDQKLVYYDFAADSLDANGNRDTSKVDLTKPIAVGWIGPSLTPMAGGANANPSWSYYQVDTTTFSVTGAQVYYADISKASWKWQNMDGKWKQLYDARQAYGPKEKVADDVTLGPEFWHNNLAQVIETNAAVAKKYGGYEVRDSPFALPCTSKQCLAKKKCSIQAGTAEAASACASQDSSDPARRMKK